jgi:WD40 repeat protein
MNMIFRSLILSLVVSSQANAGDEFIHKKWFQIEFCESIRHFGFDEAALNGKLPAYGISSDTFDPTGQMHFRRWNLLTGDELLHVAIPPSEGTSKVKLYGATISEDGTQALIASGNQDVVLFDIKTAKVLKRYEGHRRETKHTAFGVDGMVAAADVYNRIWIWGEDPSRPINVIEPIGGILDIHFSEDGSKLIVFGYEMFSTFDVKTGKRLTFTEISPDLSRDHYAVSEDGTMFVATTEDKQTKLYDRETGALLWSYQHEPNPNIPEGFPDYIYGHAISPNGRCVIASGSDNLTIFDAASGAKLASQKQNVGHFYMTFSPDNKYLVTGGSCSVDVLETPSICL